MTIVSAGVWLLLAGAIFCSAYLTFLSAVALIDRLLGGRKTAAGRLRLAVIVPAHNEEKLLPRLLATLASQDYPRDLFAIHVIADNCDDATADVARQFGVSVHERTQPDQRGKGQALAWLLPRLMEGREDAFVFIDADSEVDKSFLQTISSRMASSGWRAVQASYRVSSPDSTPIVTLRALAFALMHDLRGRAKSRLGLSCGIWGNGFAIEKETLRRIGWQSFSVTEDAEQHIRLLLAGVRVRFEPDAHVFGHMPGTLESSGTQQQRWEAGRMALLRGHWRQLLTAVRTTRNASPAVTLIELALPPLSVIVAVDTLVIGLSFAMLGTGGGILSLAGIGGLLVYCLTGFALSGLQPRSYLAVLHAPRYVAWKVALYVRELLRRAEPAWVRTTRDGPA